ncbi:hypothetical protein BDW02DRAFT_498827 [Decorospora gaudefroyi]|uniref:F-box domain-containing protein n=1 Tax=Decorospora gaudefroyi TaxID=184978 RepID=A0A6A5KL64_9PLEO|nr:hypothetical protein BDW02DRAFT_498827 [Decorospora gaudefroyi]
MATLVSPEPYAPFMTSPRIPVELVLKTIQHLPFQDGNQIATLRTAHPRLRALFTNYEHSIAKHFMKNELRHAQTDFPCHETRLSVDWLATCVKSYDTVDEVMHALCSPHNNHAIPRHNIPLANAGLLLLYRLAAQDSHAHKLTYLTTLPNDALTALYLTLHHATLTARYTGSGWINQRSYGRFMDANQISLRTDLEFSFVEAVLCSADGPALILDTLLGRPCAEITLLNVYHECGTRDWAWPCWGDGKGEFEPPRTQGPVREVRGGSTLYSCLLEGLARGLGCGIEGVRGKVEERLAERGSGIAWLSLEGKARLLLGLDVDV